MPQEPDDVTATELGHALIRWVVDEDPGGAANFLPDFIPADVDDEKAKRLGYSVLELLQRIDVA